MKIKIKVLKSYLFSMFLAMGLYTSVAWAGEAGLFYVKVTPDKIDNLIQIPGLEIKGNEIVIKWRLKDDFTIDTNIMDDTSHGNPILSPDNQAMDELAQFGAMVSTTKGYEYIFSRNGSKWTLKLFYAETGQPTTKIFEGDTIKGTTLYGLSDNRYPLLEDVEPALAACIKDANVSCALPTVQVKNHPAIMSGKCTFTNGKDAITNMKFYVDGLVRITTDRLFRLDYQTEENMKMLIEKGMRIGRAIYDQDSNILGANNFTSLAGDKDANIKEISLRRGVLRNGKYTGFIAKPVFGKEIEEQWSYTTIYINPNTVPQTREINCKLELYDIKQSDASSAERKAK